MHYSELQSQAFLRADLENLLRAIKRTNDALASHLNDQSVQAYRLGFDAALLAVATALNVRLDPFEAVYNREGFGPYGDYSVISQQGGSNQRGAGLTGPQRR